MASSSEVIQNFVAAFVAAWPAGDASPLAKFFSNEAIYQNMPMDPIEGRRAIVETLEGFMAMGGRVEVDLLHLVADREIVMTERVQTVSLALRGPSRFR